MYYDNNSNIRPNYTNSQRNNPYGYPNYPSYANIPECNADYQRRETKLKDYGPDPFVVNIKEATIQNSNFRTALWTGNHLQLTLMCINVRDEIGLELHPDVDQFIRIEQGQGLVMMGDNRENLCYRQRVFNDYVIFIPAGKWHNLINTGCVPLKVYSIYAPPQHPHGTVHKTRRDAQEHHEY